MTSGASDELATSRQRTSSPHAEVMSVEWLDSCEAIEVLLAEYLSTRPLKRFLTIRFLLTRKPMEEGQRIDPSDPNTYTVKGRWCLQGHLDPDLQAKVEEDKLQSQ